jgi:saposin
VECIVCETIMQYVEKAMTSRNSKDEIEHIIHRACDALPRHMAEKCNNFVNEYAEIVIELLSQEVSPKEICTIIGLCNSEATKLEESVAECALCQTIVTDIEKLLDDPKTGENIEEVIAKVCKYLPADQQGKCTMLMEIYEQSIVNLIHAGGDTRKICSKLSLCSSNDFLVMMTKGRSRRQADDKNLGTKPCTWGISYWCVDDKTAEECKATELCKKKGRLPESTTAAKSATENQDVASENEQSENAESTPKKNDS